MSLVATLESLTPEQRLEFSKRLAVALVSHSHTKRTEERRAASAQAEQEAKQNQEAQRLAQLRTELDQLYN